MPNRVGVSSAADVQGEGTQPQGRGMLREPPNNNPDARGEMGETLGAAQGVEPLAAAGAVARYQSLARSIRLIIALLPQTLRTFQTIPAVQPATVFNPQARGFQNRITPQTQPR
jgi:hypothetical protein